ncbi:peptide deformylase [Methylobacterium sp. J-077]|uniref:peptide deformylase n=1 Tax=Methylobacterium sp. J-077 TaxID=2836656 RepID=UPI001FB9C6AD|nr:peptide deformylase [Methylobacterium sp. J-077]MCJ2123954.1 peptide deformylase [Methylobacterium sp. J-077]
MTIRPLVILPDAVLRRISDPVGPITPEIRTLVADMFETMYDAPGVGLAAIQVGVAKRVVTIDTSKEEGVRDARVFIDPEITWASEEKRVYDEGCLSIPEYYAEVERPDRVRVKFRDIEGREQEIEADGLLATCIQHEIDHLNGVLFIDHISRLKRDRVIKRFTKAAKRDAA